uniref:Uncharacterized protein n=1 Tax=Tanacetum cinerariifolium TaxID=118510 RepID=A0A6L2JMK5_TANCI|nr:hypothetical protein [Tanacetum cinerariifolium]
MKMKMRYDAYDYVYKNYFFSQIMYMDFKGRIWVKDDPTRRCGRQQTDATFDLSEPYFSSKTLDDACKGIQNEIADTSEACAAIYGSAHITNQETRAAIYGSVNVTNQGAIWNYKTHDYGLKKVILPERNKRDLVELPSAVPGILEGLRGELRYYLIHIEEELLLAFKHECCLSETRKESRMNGFSVLFRRFVPRIFISFTRPRFSSDYHSDTV